MIKYVKQFKVKLRFKSAVCKHKFLCYLEYSTTVIRTHKYKKPLKNLYSPVIYYYDNLCI